MSYKKRITISEESLVDLLKTRNPKAMGVVYNNYSSALYGVIHRIVQKDEIAEDVLQEAFIKIWKNIDNYDISKGRLFTWMMNLCRNLAIDKVRSKEYVKETKKVNMDDFMKFNSYHNHVHENNTDKIGVKKLVDQLEPEQRSIVDLLYFGGYTQAEVAEHLNIPLGTVKTRSRMAIANLRKNFDTVKNEY